MDELLDRRPILIALAGPNGAGKSTFYKAHLQASGLPFINADELALELRLEAYQAADLAGDIRNERLGRRESFIFETVFSDPVGDKLAFLERAARSGYTVVLFFIGIDSPETSVERVAMRALKGGHDVPSEKLEERYARTMENLRCSLAVLPNIQVYDNSDLKRPYRLVATKKNGQALELREPISEWLLAFLP
jgi:predicted ABC-type ATPase